MCGFAAMIGLNGRPADAHVVDRMSDCIRHRGPDDAGRFVQGSVGLGFRRLAILDLSPAGHQPMVSADGRYVLVYNGEIYNYIELRRELEQYGHVFRSSGDTEVLLAAYVRWGRDCLQKLNGMWAFLVYDLHRQIIFGSRDRFGVKPLYRYRVGDLVFFGSEIKTILASGHYREGTNWRVAATFLLRQQLDATEETFFSGITRISAGSAFELDLRGQYREWKYWSLPPCDEGAVEGPVERFGELFDDSVTLRMRSDVPVGVSLSGGLDSTSIVCAMARSQATAPPTGDALWAFSYNAAEFDESAFVRDTLEQTGARLIGLEIDARTLLPRLRDVLWYHDEPVHSMTALISFELMRLAAKNGIKVILGGQGADETLAGYRLYFRHYWTTLLATRGLAHTRREIGAYTRVHGGDPARLLAAAVGQLLRGKARALPAYRGRAERRMHRIACANPCFARELSAALPVDRLEADQTLNAALRHSIERADLPLYLRVDDRNSMAHSLEMRLPFMDYRLVSYAHGLPAEWKMRGPWNKYILRESMRGRIPESVRTRPEKFGFPFPSGAWLEGGVRQYLLELLGTQAMRERGIYDLAAIRTALDGGADVADLAFNLIQFETWAGLR